VGPRPSTDTAHEIPGYELIETLGEGTFGVAYKARDLNVPRFVAIKLLKAGVRSSVVDRFQDEVTALARVQHPNIVQIFAVGSCASGPYLVMEYVPGGTLGSKKAPLVPETAAAVAAAAAWGVHAAHRAGVYHRDLKPANILLGAPVAGNSGNTPLGFPKVGDFGVAKLVDEAGQAGYTDTSAGTLSYMAPEQIDLGLAPITAATDVYGLGAVLFHLLTGKPPYVSGSRVDLIRKVLHDSIPSVRQVSDAVPVTLDAIVQRCLAKQPSARFRSAEELAKALDDYRGRDTSESREDVAAAVESSSTSQLSTTSILLFADLNDSTGWKKVLGDRDYANELRLPHDRIFRKLLLQYPGALERDSTGDGFLATFLTPSDAVTFALNFHQALISHTWGEPIRKVSKFPTTRIGIHLGEVVEFADPTGKKVSGQAVDLAARVMSLASGGQTLLTRHLFDSARQHVREASLFWANHGKYRFKGNEDDLLEVCEVGIGYPPTSPPLDNEKAKRVIVDPDDEIGSWRPAAGLAIPRRDGWCIESKLGEGGFGEVWLARHKRTKKTRVFKFCFDAERLRSFKRELTFFKLIQNELGDRPDFVKLHEVQIEKPPYFLESDYVEAGNLSQWVERRGGIAGWQLDSRIRFLAKVAKAVAAAHSLGIIHKDLKPSNIFVAINPNEDPQPLVADFGIGVLTDRSMLNRGNITETGFTESVMLGNDSSRTGTRLYSPPESHLGKPATTSTDVYALGVMVFQFSAGDLNRPLGVGWEKSIPTDDADRSSILIEDIAAATYSDPAVRLSTAAELANRLNNIDQRIVALKLSRAREEKDRREFERRKRRKLLTRIAAVTIVTLAVGGIVAGMGWISASRERDQKEFARKKEADARSRTRDAMNALTDGVVERLFAKQVRLRDDEKAFLKNVQKFHEEFAAAAENSIEDLESKGDGLYRVGNIQQKLGELIEAEESYCNSITTFVLLTTGQPNLIEDWAKLANVYRELGHVRSKRQKYTEAESAYIYARDILKDLTNREHTIPTYSANLARIHSSLAYVQSKTNRMKDANSEYLNAENILTTLVSVYPTSSYYRDALARELSNHATLLIANLNLIDAESKTRKAIDLFSGLATEFSDDPEFRDSLARTMGGLGRLLSMVKNKEKEAKEAYLSAISEYVILAKDFPSIPEYRAGLAQTYASYGHYLIRNNLEESESAYRDAVILLTRLCTDFPKTPSYRDSLAKVQLEYGNILRVTKRLKEAEIAYRQSLSLIVQLASELPDEIEHRKSLAHIHTILGHLLRADGRMDEAEVEYREALAILDQLAVKIPTPENRADLARTQIGMAKLFRTNGNKERAESVFKEAVNTFTILTREFPAMSDYSNSLANALGELSALLADDNRFIEARKLLESAIPHHRAALSAIPSHPTYRQFDRDNTRLLTHTLLALGDHANAAVSADQLAHCEVDPVADRFDAARFMSLCVSVAAVDSALSNDERRKTVDSYGRRSVLLLNTIIDNGMKDMALKLKNKDFDSIRERADYINILRRIEK
jgi:serine/threonine protein kinase